MGIRFSIWDIVASYLLTIDGKNREQFDGREHRPPAKLLCGKDVLCQLNGIMHPTFCKAMEKTRMRKHPACNFHWTKKVYFFICPISNM